MSALTNVTGVPAMTMREIRLGLAGRSGERHWSSGACWCEARHDGRVAGLNMTAPPWDESRNGERAR